MFSFLQKSVGGQKCQKLSLLKRNITVNTRNVSCSDILQKKGFFFYNFLWEKLEGNKSATIGIIPWIIDFFCGKIAFFSILFFTMSRCARRQQKATKELCLLAIEFPVCKFCYFMYHKNCWESLQKYIYGISILLLSWFFYCCFFSFLPSIHDYLIKTFNFLTILFFVVNVNDILFCRAHTVKKCAVFTANCCSPQQNNTTILSAHMKIRKNVLQVAFWFRVGVKKLFQTFCFLFLFHAQNIVSNCTWKLLLLSTHVLNKHEKYLEYHPCNLHWMFYLEEIKLTVLRRICNDIFQCTFFNHLLLPITCHHFKLF